MKPNPLPETDRLHSLLDYDMESGTLTWRQRPEAMFEGLRYPAARHAKVWNSKFAGKPALTAPMSNGYRHGTVDGRHYLAHRIIWKLTTGTDPDDIDHINGDRADNRFCNLRNCSRVENMRNRGLSANNNSGHHGVWQEAKTGKWCAQMEHDAKVTDLGRHETREQAIIARKDAERRFGFHPNHGARVGHRIASASLPS